MPRVSERRIAVGMGGHQAAGAVTDEWYTPPSVFEALGLAFDLDPCAPRGGLPWIPARRFLSLDDNGLASTWRGRVWLNPPYGPQTGRWLAKLADHGDGVALVFARTDTTWFQDVAPRADAVCFVRGRIRFIRADGRAGRYTGGAPSALVGYGPAAAKAVARCGLGLTCTFADVPSDLRLA